MNLVDIARKKVPSREKFEAGMKAERISKIVTACIYTTQTITYVSRIVGGKVNFCSSGVDRTPMYSLISYSDTLSRFE